MPKNILIYFQIINTLKITTPQTHLRPSSFNLS
ncbi:hypothetical protein NC652_037350 [Populus alba x Populus x berolinensis]|nr:hypothetical protein NC652_037350 [Populus alba x Populus x berolinensis]